MLSLFPSRTIALELFGFPIHWYGLMYLAGFATAYYLLPQLQRYRNLSLTKDDWANLLSVAILGVIIGGRLGFVLLYEPSYFLQNPQDIFAVWKGGMSSHGGFIGVILGLIWFTRKHNIPLLTLGDIVVVPVALGLAFGRIGNFINQELYGIATILPWGIDIPWEAEPRHPTQIYAVIKNLFTAFCCYVHLRTTRSYSGQTAAIFLTLYGILRFLNEYVRVPSHESFTVLELTLTRGQWYSVPLIFFGIGLWFYAQHRGANADGN